MKNSKWFYPAQEKISKWLEKFNQVQCQFQDVCENVVYENYLVREKPEDAPTYIQFVIHKGATENRPQIIHTFWLKYEDTLQYFAPKK